MERSRRDKRIQNEISLIISESWRLFYYYTKSNVKKKRKYGAIKAHKVFILGMLKRKRNAKKM